MDDKKYPYIGECVNGMVLFTGKNTGAPIQKKNNAWKDAEIDAEIDVYTSDWTEEDFTNITKEYLKNTKFVVQSPEKSKLIQKMVFNHGGCWSEHGQKVMFEDAPYLFIGENLCLIYSESVFAFHACIFVHKVLPLPPKEQSEKNHIKEEWPQSGSEVFHDGELYHYLCKSPYDKLAVITKAETEDWDVISVSYDELEKPLTPEKELEEKLADILTGITGYQDRQAVLKGARMIINGEAEGLIYKEEK